MNSSREETKKEYSEDLRGNHEMEFEYGGYEYLMSYNSNNGYSIWEYNPDREKGHEIASADSPEDLLEMRCFNEKTFLEITEEIKNWVMF